jgi:hypothetical protein
MALRSAELARLLGLGSGNVAAALAWLANRPDTHVMRRRTDTELWDKYWFDVATPAMRADTALLDHAVEI